MQIYPLDLNSLVIEFHTSQIIPRLMFCNIKGHLYHYSMLFPDQVKNKCSYYKDDILGIDGDGPLSGSGKVIAALHLTC